MSKAGLVGIEYLYSVVATISYLALKFWVPFCAESLSHFSSTSVSWPCPGLDLEHFATLWCSVLSQHFAFDLAVVDDGWESWQSNWQRLWEERYDLCVSWVSHGQRLKSFHSIGLSQCAECYGSLPPVRRWRWLRPYDSDRYRRASGCSKCLRNCYSWHHQISIAANHSFQIYKHY